MKADVNIILRSELNQIQQVCNWSMYEQLLAHKSFKSTFVEKKADDRLFMFHFPQDATSEIKPGQQSKSNVNESYFYVRSSLLHSKEKAK
ncbi:unnamed protein product, partial [Dovyalis caffra]